MQNMEGIKPELLEKRIREILIGGSIIYSDHVKERMSERGYSLPDVLYILRNGKVTSFTKEGNERYKCEIRGEDLEGRQGAVISIVIKTVKLIIVTVLGGT
jgi:hypothetical protein